MFKITRVFVPVDFSNASRKAVGYGITVATAFEADLVVASVVDDSMVDAYIGEGIPKPSTLSLDGVRTVLENLVSTDVRKSIHCDFVAVAGSPEDEILSAIQESGADLVVMGTHGRRAFARWFMGSVTEHMLRRVPVPVLTVSHPEEDQRPWSVSGGRILYSTDLSRDCRSGLLLAYEMAEKFEATLTVLHVNRPAAVETGIVRLALEGSVDTTDFHAGLLAQLEQFVPDAMRADPRVDVQLREGVPYEVVTSTATELSADLVVLSLHGTGPGERALLGVTAERVVRSAHCPVLSIPVVATANSE